MSSRSSCFVMERVPTISVLSSVGWSRLFTVSVISGFGSEVSTNDIQAADVVVQVAESVM